jgi:glutathione S-transferase
MKLVGTPLSHFTRKIRILLLELGIDAEFVRAPGVMTTTLASYGDNPLLRVPTLLHDGRTIIESDHIARYVVASFDASDRLRVRSDDVDDMNRLAVMNGIMANEAVLILAKRGGVEDIDGVVYFRKLKTAIGEGLRWLDNHVDVEREDFDYRDVVLVCMWDHFAHYGLVPLDPYARVRARVDRFALRASVSSTTPAQSLKDAEAAGWKPEVVLTRPS